jgi:hypothetical protein
LFQIQEVVNKRLLLVLLQTRGVEMLKDELFHGSKGSDLVIIFESRSDLWTFQKRRRRREGKEIKRWSKSWRRMRERRRGRLRGSLLRRRH